MLGCSTVVSGWGVECLQSAGAWGAVSVHSSVVSEQPKVSNGFAWMFPI